MDRSGSKSDAQLHRLVEDMGFAFERFGMTRILGRLLGWLMVCEPAEQSAEDLCRELGVSKGSISTSTRQLLQLNLIARSTRPGERRTYFYLPQDMMRHMVETDLAAMRMFLRLLRQAHAVVLERGTSAAARLDRWLRTLEFFEREYPALIERCERELERGR